MIMRQGEIWHADLNPVAGSEQAGRRPVVIISGETMNRTLPIVIAVPLSSKIKSYPTCVLVRPNRENGLKKDAEAIPFQVRAISKKRLVRRIGAVSLGETREIIRGLLMVMTH